MSSLIRVWDAPTRLFHWLLVALFAFSWWSAENHEMESHILSGSALLGLLVFRLVWGVIGGSTARFASFVKPPPVVVDYLRGQGNPKPGHNPLGAYSVVAMLLALCVQVSSGLFATDVDGLDSGPLSFLISFDQSRAMADLHDAAFTILLVLIALHLLAVLFYLLVRRRNLVWPMITGTDAAPAASAADGLEAATPWKLAITVSIAVAIGWWCWKGFGL